MAAVVLLLASLPVPAAALQRHVPRPGSLYVEPGGSVYLLFFDKSYVAAGGLLRLYVYAFNTTGPLSGSTVSVDVHFESPSASKTLSYRLVVNRLGYAVAEVRVPGWAAGGHVYAELAAPTDADVLDAAYAEVVGGELVVLCTGAACGQQGSTVYAEAGNQTFLVAALNLSTLKPLEGRGSITVTCGGRRVEEANLSFTGGVAGVNVTLPPGSCTVRVDAGGSTEDFTVEVLPSLIYASPLLGRDWLSGDVEVADPFLVFNAHGVAVAGRGNLTFRVTEEDGGVSWLNYTAPMDGGVAVLRLRSGGHTLIYAEPLEARVGGAAYRVVGDGFTAVSASTTGAAGRSPLNVALCLGYLAGRLAWVSARVTDSQGRPVPGATVYFLTPFDPESPVYVNVTGGDGAASAPAGEMLLESIKADPSMYYLLDEVVGVVAVARGSAAADAVYFSYPPYGAAAVEARLSGDTLKLTLRPPRGDTVVPLLVSAELLPPITGHSRRVVYLGVLEPGSTVNITTVLGDSYGRVAAYIYTLSGSYGSLPVPLRVPASLSAGARVEDGKLVVLGRVDGPADVVEGARVVAVAVYRDGHTRVACARVEDGSFKIYFPGADDVESVSIAGIGGNGLVFGGPAGEPAQFWISVSRPVPVAPEHGAWALLAALLAGASTAALLWLTRLAPPDRAVLVGVAAAALLLLALYLVNA